jgi:hypothetical protein
VRRHDCTSAFAGNNLVVTVRQRDRINTVAAKNVLVTTQSGDRTRAVARLYDMVIPPIQWCSKAEISRQDI